MIPRDHGIDPDTLRREGRWDELAKYDNLFDIDEDRRIWKDENCNNGDEKGTEPTQS